MTILRQTLLSTAFGLMLAIEPALAQETPAAGANAPADVTSEVPAEDAEAGTSAETPDAAAETGTPATPSAEIADVGTLSPFVVDVQIVAPWSDGERRGVWRTVMAQPSGGVAGNRFFVQQIEDVDGSPALASSIEITDVAEVDGAVIGYRADEPSQSQPNSLALFLDIVPLDGEIAETYELFVTPGEPYIFGPATN